MVGYVVRHDRHSRRIRQGVGERSRQESQDEETTAVQLKKTSRDEKAKALDYYIEAYQKQETDGGVPYETWHSGE